jgi:hypothetical protein
MDEPVFVSPWRRRRKLAVRVLALLALPALAWQCRPRGLPVAAFNIRSTHVERGVAALLLPDEDYPADSGGTWVFVLDGSEATRRSVVLGRRGNGQVEVVRGLAEGESVIAPPYAGFGDASRLHIVD